MTESAPVPDAEPTIGQLTSDLTQQSSRLVREELQLARLELQDAARHAGKGAGAFGIAAVLAWFGVGCVIATAIISLNLVLPLWLAALLVTIVLFAVA